MTKIASLAVLIAGLVAAFTGGRVWVRFTVDDPVLGPGARAATGYAVSSALSAACIVALAAGLAALLTRRSPRSIALLILAVDAAWGSWLTLRVLTDPAQAASTSGSPDFGLTVTGELSAQGAHTTVYAFMFLAAAVIVACAAIVVAVGTSTLFAHPTTQASAVALRETKGGTAKPLPAAEYERRANAAAWNDLSRGNDPTATDLEGTSEMPLRDSDPPDSRA